MYLYMYTVIGKRFLPPDFFISSTDEPSPYTCGVTGRCIVGEFWTVQCVWNYN